MGTGYISNSKKEFLNLQEIKDYFKKNNIESSVQWKKYCKDGKKPNNIPSGIEQYFKTEWKGWADFIGKEKK